MAAKKSIYGIVITIAMSVSALAQVTPPAVLTPADPALRGWWRSDAGVTTATTIGGTPVTTNPVISWLDQTQYGTILAPRIEANSNGPIGPFPIEERPHLVTSTINGKSVPTIRFDREGDIFTTGDPNVDGSGSTDRLYQTNNLSPSFDPLQIGDGSDFTYFTVFNPDLTTTPGLGYQAVFGKRGTNGSLYTLQIKQIGQAAVRGTFENTSYDEIEQYITGSVRAEKKWHVTSMVIDDLGDNMSNTDTIKFFDDESESAVTKMTDVGVVRGNTLVGTPVTAMANRNPASSVPEAFGIGGHNQNCCGEGETFAGNIAEIIIFARTLSAQERLDIENYLDAKYFAGAPAVAGDYDGDGDVDDIDLFVWKSQFNTVPPAKPNADGDNDGDVDGNDVLIWQRGLGAHPAVSAAGVVPEPMTAVLAFMALAMLGRRPRRACRSTR